MKIDGISVTSVERQVESTIERRLHGENSMAPTAKRFISDMEGIAVSSTGVENPTSKDRELPPNRQGEGTIDIDNKTKDDSNQPVTLKL